MAIQSSIISLNYLQVYLPTYINDLSTLVHVNKWTKPDNQHNIPFSHLSKQLTTVMSDLSWTISNIKIKIKIIQITNNSSVLQLFITVDSYTYCLLLKQGFT